jgi:hypothetical protein
MTSFKTKLAGSALAAVAVCISGAGMAATTLPGSAYALTVITTLGPPLTGCMAFDYFGNTVMKIATPAGIYSIPPSPYFSVDFPGGPVTWQSVTVPQYAGDKSAGANLSGAVERGGKGVFGTIEYAKDGVAINESFTGTLSSSTSCSVQTPSAHR